MGKILKHIDIKWFPVLVLLIYVPFHVTEEAIFQFPYWMYKHYGLPKPLSYPHWLINNLIFFLTLLTGLLIYLKNKKKKLFFAAGILIWAFMNSMEHIVFSIIDLNLVPGFFSALLFLVVSVTGFIKLQLDDKLKSMFILKTVFAGLGYWAVAFALIISLGNMLMKIFP
jgi:hypothetical protein